jgi:ubiquinone/menaquinone biosynthesis C-methylase UbiE
MKSKYRHIKRFSLDIGISEEILGEAFEVEKEFHLRILNEIDSKKRKELYREVYNTVHTLYGKAKLSTKQNSKINLVKKFGNAFYRKSILDVGCGNGDLLRAIREKGKPRRLVGIDISEYVMPNSDSAIEFVKSDIIDFNLDDKFDFVFSDNVIEHIAPLDMESHLKSIKRILQPDGKLIILMPNRLFGPSDVTRIIDYTYTNKVPAQGTHINETTYTEIIELLKKHGFNKFKTIIPLPKIKSIFPRLRINAKIITFIEKNEWFIKLLHKFKYKSKCVLKLDIFLECSY